TGGGLVAVTGEYAPRPDILGSAPATGTPAQAARFLQQASFGVTPQELDRGQKLDIAGCIDDQITKQPATFHSHYIEQIYADYQNGHTDDTYLVSTNDGSANVDPNNCDTAFARAALTGPDQL